MHRITGALALGAMTLLATGCLTSDAYLTIDDDGSGELRAEVTPPVEVSDELEATQAEALARDVLEGVEGASFETQERRGRTTYIVEVPFDDYRDLTTNIAGGATVEGQRFTPFSQFDLRELPGGGWSLNAVTNPLAQAVSFSEGSPLVGLQGLAGSKEAGAGLELSVTLPGRLTDSNAESQEDNTARWDLLDPTASYVLQMRTEAAPLLSPLQWVLVGLVGLFVVGGALMSIGASGPVKRKALFGSRKHVNKTGPAGPTGWENPGQGAPLDPGAVTTGGGDPTGGVQPPPYLPPLDSGSHQHAPGDDATVES